MTYLLVGILHLVACQLGVVDGDDEFGDDIVWVASMTAPLVDIVHLTTTEQTGIADGRKYSTTDKQ